MNYWTLLINSSISISSVINF